MIRMVGIIAIFALMSGCYTTGGGYSSGYYSAPANVPQDAYLHTPDINVGGVKSCYEEEGRYRPRDSMSEIYGAMEAGKQNRARTRNLELQNALLEQQLRER